MDEFARKQCDDIYGEVFIGDGMLIGLPCGKDSSTKKLD